MTYFEGLNTTGDVKREFDRLTKIYHPDARGGKANANTYLAILQAREQAVIALSRPNTNLEPRAIVVKRASSKFNTTLNYQRQINTRAFPVPLEEDGRVPRAIRTKVERIEAAFAKLKPHGILPGRFTMGWEGSNFWLAGKLNKTEWFYMLRFGFEFYPNRQRWQLKLPGDRK